MLETRIQFSIDVVVPVEITEGDLLYNHGLSNFIFETSKELIEQLKTAVARQITEQHAEIVADERTFYDCKSELRGMFTPHAGGTERFPTERFNRERALELRKIMLDMLKKYGMEDSPPAQTMEEYFKKVETL